MAEDRRTRIICRLSRRAEIEVSTALLCQVAVEVTGVSGAGIMLLCGDVAQVSAGASNEVSARIEEMQYMLGEGPALDAYQQDRPVLEPDLADPGNVRWLGFTAPAVEAGVRAVFGVPLHVGAVKFGALHLYRDRPGSLNGDQHADALAMADVAAEAVLLMQADAPPGALAAELATGANMRSVVHQAAGMISGQLAVSVAQALIRLRAYAFRSDRRLVDVAGEVVDRRLRFDDD